MSAVTRPAAKSFVFEVSLLARDRAKLAIDVTEDGEIISASLTGTGCGEMLRAMKSLRPLLKGVIAEVPLPSGSHHTAILLRELLLKAQGRWDFPFKLDEICHCRGIATAKVDSAIIGGCHSVEAVKRMTGANTSCGTCRWDIESVLEYRLKTP